MAKAVRSKKDSGNTWGTATMNIQAETLGKLQNIGKNMFPPISMSELELAIYKEEWQYGTKKGFTTRNQ